MRINVGNRTRGRVVIACTTIGLMLLGAARADAVTSCTSTVSNPGTYDADTDTYALQDDYSSASYGSPCITVTGGSNLDLDGHTVTRSVIGNVGSALIDCTQVGSRVTDSSDPRTGDIEGTSGGYAIKNCEDVVGIRISGTYTYGIYNSSSYKANTISENHIEPDGTGTITYGIDVVPLDNSSQITNNLAVVTNVGISVVGTTGAGSGASVDHNIIRGARYGGIVKTGTDKIRIRNNLMIEPDFDEYPGGGEACVSIVSTNSTVNDNWCECDVSDCEGLFEDPPYVFPGLF